MRLATRGSALALTQARLVARQLESAERGLRVEVVTIATSGDEAGGRRVADAGPRDKSRFVKEIEEALLRGDVDLAVHSAKDLPGELPEGLEIVGVPARADARDSLCGARTLAALAHGAGVGTSSLRRRSQLLAVRPDLRVEHLRGNVDTRLRRLARGDYDAIVLAQAGLDRLGRGEGHPIPGRDMTPAPGQGCLALEARKGDERASSLAGRVSDRMSRLRLTAERALVRALGASCHTPVGAYAEPDDGQLVLWAYAGLPDGSEWIRDRLAGHPEDGEGLGASVAERLRAAGADELLAAAAAGGSDDMLTGAAQPSAVARAAPLGR